MLSNTNAAANIAVRDVKAARAFYQDILGLEEVSHMDDDVVVLKSGETVLVIYRSEFAGTNKATAVTWAVGAEINSIVRDLRSKGVPFEHYDMPGTTLDGDIHVGHGMKVAWFKDPDGNILNVIDQ
ncbi:VOC family protein [Mesorhizobium amorphae]|uniref:VOC family protein n=1 Tax=Mesorhizobium amorphae TaxID=71433 RepID=UPI001187196B|nr:VOC family protein [Mesorhizobium amorphae]